jgi:hypothetical protein
MAGQVVGPAFLPEVGMKRTIVRVSTLALLLLVVGCGPSGGDPKKDASPPQDKDAASTKDKDSSAPKDTVTVEARDLGESFRMDKAGADKRYQGKTLTVQGQIHSLQPADGKFRVVLSGDAIPNWDGKVVYPIECLFDGAEVQKVADLTPTQFVKVTGKYQGVEGNRIKLADCRLDKTFADPAVTVRSTDLAKDLVTNEEKTFAKYVGHYVILEGKVVDGPPELRTTNTFFLEGYQKEGGQPVAVLVKCGDAQADAIKGFKAGDAVKLKGKCRGRSEAIVTVEFYAWVK